MVSTPLKKYEFVSWDDDIPNRWKNKSHVPNHQSAIYKWVLVHFFSLHMFVRSLHGKSYSN